MSLQTTSFAPLLKERYVSLTTFRKNGAAVATPVWFVERNGTLYIGTGATAGKVKRIRHSGRVTLAPCTARGQVLGPPVEGKASILGDQEEIARAHTDARKQVRDAVPPDCLLPRHREIPASPDR